MGDASSCKGFKLSQIHRVRTHTKHGYWVYERRDTNLDLEVGSGETRNLKRVERHKRMKIEMKIKETRWGKELILD